ncbi:YihY/virulence factor BrkB family protein [Lutibacter sp. HS1-25]|nr:YihY/virulence factor BrkB family protein [Lutibacter sp. HS1-25]RXP50041.1 YihY/virulence factor BrkB family protein [Lutibacter sp. HS1-25]RXP52342.1 YihY/virulence factor BrkB family protein [Lutibacter sp. HS1-25]RXP52519.1 YihY/virulence factor BrkB family protein [Lutibacter sp. HS1-25]
MTKPIEENLDKIPVVNLVIRLIKKVKIPGLLGLSLYDLLEMYIIGIFKGALTSRAGGIAFSFFMALFPFLLFILTLIPYVQIEGFQQDFLNTIEHLLPPNTFESVQGVIVDIANNRYGGLLSFGFITSVFLMTNGVNAVLGGFEYSYHISEMRNIIRQYFVSMGMAILLAVVLLITVALNIYFEMAVNNLTVSGLLVDDVFWIQYGRYVFFIVLIYVSVSFLYKYGTKETKEISYVPGALLTTLLTLLMFKLFAVYVIKFSTYNELYGSIGTLLILMLFVWLNSIILLLGFELNASIYSLKKQSQN